MIRDTARAGIPRVPSRTVNHWIASAWSSTSPQRRSTSSEPRIPATIEVKKTTAPALVKRLETRATLGGLEHARRALREGDAASVGGSLRVR